MDDAFSTFFIVFVLALYSVITLVFVAGAIRKWIWRPIAARIWASRSEGSYHRIKSTHHEGSPS